MHRIALIAGATGLVGRELLSLLLDDTEVSEVVALSRRPLAMPHPKLQEGIVEFDQLDDFVLPPVDDFYCCLGTTIKAAGSPEAFREVDLVYPATIARMALAAGATQCLLVSAVGADAKSRVYYNQVKGEVEAEVMGLALSDRLRVSAVAPRRSSRGVPPGRARGTRDCAAAFLPAAGGHQADFGRRRCARHAYLQQARRGRTIRRPVARNTPDR